MTHEDQDLPTASTPPVTGHELIDQTLADADFSGDLADHPRRVEAILEVLQQALQVR